MGKEYPYTDEDKRMYSMRYNKDVGYYLLRKRTQLGLSLRTVSKNTGIGRSTISRIENNEIVPHWNTLISLLNFYHDVQLGFRLV